MPFTLSTLAADSLKAELFALYEAADGGTVGSWEELCAGGCAGARADSLDDLREHVQLWLRAAMRQKDIGLLVLFVLLFYFNLKQAFFDALLAT